MRIRIIPRGDGTFQPMAEVGVGKGKRVTTGRKVSKKAFKAEVARLVAEVRGGPQAVQPG